MNRDGLKDALTHALDRVADWENTYPAFATHDALALAPATLHEALNRYTDKLRGNYPFFHPDYAGQMLKPPHPAAIAGYVAAMTINPNNHALDGGPPTSEMEKEVIGMLAAMFGLPDDALGHLTSSGTIANLEALFVARSLHPEKGVASSAAAHYTHARMAHVLGMAHHTVTTTADDAMDLDALEALLRTGTIGTVIVTSGTTGTGTVDPIDQVVVLARQYGARVHVDGAYGGFFALLAHDNGPLQPDVARRFRAIAQCDSVVVDPHKHGLQPYGCGCVLFRDPSVGGFYKHDSPYTYFTSEALHLGEISLECSRAGAAAGALWLTLELLPLDAHRGLGPILAACIRAAGTFTRALNESAHLVALRPTVDLDIVTYAPRRSSASEIDGASQAVFEQAMTADHPVFVSVYRVESRAMTAALPHLHLDVAQARVLRSVLMKPEHEHAADALVSRLSQIAGGVE